MQETETLPALPERHLPPPPLEEEEEGVDAPPLPVRTDGTEEDQAAAPPPPAREDCGEESEDLPPPPLPPLSSASSSQLEDPCSSPLPSPSSAPLDHPLPPPPQEEDENEAQLPPPPPRLEEEHEVEEEGQHQTTTQKEEEEALPPPPPRTFEEEGGGEESQLPPPPPREASYDVDEEELPPPPFPQRTNCLEAEPREELGGFTEGQQYERELPPVPSELPELPPRLDATLRRRRVPLAELVAEEERQGLESQEIEQRNEERAATLIQATWRGYKQRKDYKRYLEENPLVRLKKPASAPLKIVRRTGGGVGRRPPSRGHHKKVVSKPVEDAPATVPDPSLVCSDKVEDESKLTAEGSGGGGGGSRRGPSAALRAGGGSAINMQDVLRVRLKKTGETPLSSSMPLLPIPGGGMPPPSPGGGMPPPLAPLPPRLSARNSPRPNSLPSPHEGPGDPVASSLRHSLPPSSPPLSPTSSSVSPYFGASNGVDAASFSSSEQLAEGAFTKEGWSKKKASVGAILTNFFSKRAKKEDLVERGILAPSAADGSGMKRSVSFSRTAVRGDAVNAVPEPSKAVKKKGIKSKIFGRKKKPAG
ncbi:Multiple organellar RNA editing factor 8, chloroplastic/mitochondrial [Balamuthia mandrillaris]